MKLTKERLTQNINFAPAIELTFDADDDHEMWAPENHAELIETVLRSERISGVVRRPLLTSHSGNIRETHIVLIAGTCDRGRLITLIRQYLDKEHIHWYEPYAEAADIEYFSFLLPYESLFK